MPETWYVLEDGRVVSPREVTFDKSGKLSFKGTLVAMRGDVPSTRSVDPEQERGKHKTRDMKPEAPKSGYRTR